MLDRFFAEVESFLANNPIIVFGIMQDVAGMCVCA